MFILRVLLLPFAFLYGLITFIRNKFFDWGVLKSAEFEIKTISVGNLTVGGTGKSPHIEYLIRLLQNDFKIATLSRGYKRKTSGFVTANEKTTYKEIGDEPMQFHSKFKGISVNVDEKRKHGIEQILKNQPEKEVVLLDDCFQHRWVKPGLNILLIEYSSVGEKQFMLPSGELREWKSGRKRADVIVLTKSPHIHSPIEQRRIKEILNPAPYQKVFFSYIKYQNLIAFTPAAKALEASGKFNLSEFKAYVFAGIANITPLIDYLNDHAKTVITGEFSDHHNFSLADMVRISKAFKEIISSEKILITTEKDAMRLQDERLFPILESLPVFYLPIEIKFHEVGEEEGTFDTMIQNYVKQH